MRTTGMGFAFSHATDASKAMSEIMADLDDVPLAGAIMFFSHRYDWDALSKAVNVSTDGVAVIGCTSSGELTRAGYDQDSVSFLGLPAESFRMVSHCFDDIDAFDPEDGRLAIRKLAAQAEIESRTLGDTVNHVALFLVDGLSHREELLAMTVQDALGDIPLIGGSSGDDLAFRQTGIFHDGSFKTDAAVVAILSSAKPMEIFRSQHYAPGDKKMVVTGAISESRIVTEINAEPAAQEYLRLAGHPGERLDINFFAAHPPMVRAGGEYYVRSVQTANADGSLTFYCAVDEGIVLTIGEPLDAVKNIGAVLSDVAAKVGEVDYIIAFDCVLNRIDAENRQLVGPISKIYSEHRVIGFNTYGEQYHAAHVNQTFSGLAIGK